MRKHCLLFGLLLACSLFVNVGFAFADEINGNLQLQTSDSQNTIADGIYTLASAQDSNQVIDIVAGLTNDGANAATWTTYGDTRQMYWINYIGDGYYSIRPLHSGKCLDVVASGTQSGTNVTQWTYYGNDNQLWAISNAGNGTFTFTSKCNGLYLAISSPAANGSNVVVSSATDSSAQWYLSPIYIQTGRTIADGTYEIDSSVNSQMVVDVVAGSQNNGENITLWERSGTARQKYTFTYLGDGTYSIVASHSNKSMDLVASSFLPGINISQWEQTGCTNQKWYVFQNSDGTYRIISACSGLTMTAGADATYHSNIYADVWQDSVNQRFKLESCDILDDGIYYLSINGTSSVAGVSGDAYNNGANIYIQNKTSSINQRFTLTYLNNGYYRITSNLSNQSMDVVASGASDGTNVTQWPVTGANNQQWSITKKADGSYRIVSRCNDLSLTAESNTEGGNIAMYSDGYQNNSWAITAAPPVEDGSYAIKLSANTAYSFDVVAASTTEGANVTLWTFNDNNWQKFFITYVGDGYYKILAAHSGQSLDVVASGQNAGTNVTQWGYWETDNQLWTIETAGSGYRIKSKCNGLYLTVDSSSSLDGANVYVDNKRVDGSQVFKLDPVTAQKTTIKSYSFSLADAVSWQSPITSDTEYYLSPSSFSSSSSAYYRYADLRGSSSVSADQLNTYLNSNSSGRSGTLANQGQAVINAANSAQINEVFLLSVAILESGWGNSWLSSGVYYDGHGFYYPVWDNSEGRYDYEWHTLEGYDAGNYYNFFGIGAYDSSPYVGGMEKAITSGWDSVEAALKGGASWIASNYIYASSYPQETLFEMRWDLDRSEATRTRGWHQYSTNEQWDVLIAEGQMAAIYSSAGFVSPQLSYIVPKYTN